MSGGAARPPGAPGGGVTRLVVAEAEAGARLDGFLARHGLAPSAGGARRLLAAGGVRVNGRPAPKGARLAAGQIVEVAALDEPALAPDAHVALVVLHED